MKRRNSRYYRRKDETTEDDALETAVVFVNRVAKVMKGGRRFRFTALVVAGDKNGTVGLGLGKAPEVVEAIRKGEELARKNAIKLHRRGTTIPYRLKHHYCSTTVLLAPAREGSGITAGGPARALLALAGVSDCTAKFFGSNNQVNCARATFEALKSMQDPKMLVDRRRNFEQWRQRTQAESPRAAALARAKTAPEAEVELQTASGEEAHPVSVTTGGVTTQTAAPVASAAEPPSQEETAVEATAESAPEPAPPPTPADADDESSSETAAPARSDVEKSEPAAPSGDAGE